MSDFISLVLAGSGIALYSATFILFSLLYIWFVVFIRSQHLSKKAIFICIGISTFLRLLVMPVKPIGSDDYYRYIWDGKVITNGVNPYKFAPSDSALQHLHSAVIPAKVNFPGLKSIYFPTAQLFFAAAYWIGGESIWGLKILFLLSEILTIFFILGILSKSGTPQKYVLLYAFCPLAIFQVMIDSHIDALGIMLLSGMLFFFIRNRIMAAGVLFALSFMVKPAALILLPIMLFNLKDNSSRVKMATGFAATVILLFTPFIITANPFEALLIFSRDWVFNGCFFSVLFELIGNNQTARMASGAIFILFYLLIIFSSMQVKEKIMYSFLFMFLFTPVLHQWYLLWLAVLLPFVYADSALLMISLISFSIITVFNYQVYGVWKDYPIVLIAEYAPVLFFLFKEMNDRRIQGALKLKLKNLQEKSLKLL